MISDTSSETGRRRDLDRPENRPPARPRNPSVPPKERRRRPGRRRASAPRRTRQGGFDALLMGRTRGIPQALRNDLEDAGVETVRGAHSSVVSTRGDLDDRVDGGASHGRAPTAAPRPSAATSHPLRRQTPSVIRRRRSPLYERGRVIIQLLSDPTRRRPFDDMRRTKSRNELPRHMRATRIEVVSGRGRYARRRTSVSALFRQW